MPLSPAASSLAESPSTMKLLEKFRWLLTERPCPGTAEVSAKSWFDAVFVGETPGINKARSRKFRPLSGRLRTSVCGTVPAIWLRADSITGASETTVTLVACEPTGSENGRSNAAPTVSVTARMTSVNPCLPAVIS